MNMRGLGRFVAVGIVTLAFAAELAGRTAVPDPWKKVPAAPASCFADDDYREKLHQAITDLDAEIEKQAEQNAKVRESFDAMDMMEKARRMQAFMMKNPEAAMKMMQAEQAAGAAVTTAITEGSEDERKLAKELEDHNANFRDVTETAVKPIQAKQKQLIETRTKEVGEAAVPAFLTVADRDQYLALIEQENAAYEKACAPFVGPKGHFRNWLDSYRKQVIEPTSSASADAVLMTQMAIMDTPTGGYRSLEPLKGVRNYLQKVEVVYGVRRKKARPAFTDLVVSK